MNDEVATQAEYKAWFRKTGFFTAPEFLEEKFYIMTGKKIPVDEGEEE